MEESLQDFSSDEDSIDYNPFDQRTPPSANFFWDSGAQGWIDVGHETVTIQYDRDSDRDHGGWASDSDEEITYNIPRDSDRLRFETDSDEGNIYNVPTESDSDSVISERSESDYGSQTDSSYDSSYELSERLRLTDPWFRFN